MMVILEILKYTLPAAVMLLAVYLVIHRFFQQEAMRFENERRQTTRRDMFPVRMQAYERIVLLLERISPNQLILRISQPGLSVSQFQSLLTQNIRDEFDHNLSQQVYVSSKAWELVRTAREELIRQINTAAGSLPGEASSADLAGKWLELHAGTGEDPVTRALEFVKEEARKFL